MPVNLALGHASNDFLISAIVIYSTSVVAFAGDFAFGRPRRADATARVRQARERSAALATVGAASATTDGGSRADAPGSHGTAPVPAAADSMPEPAVPALRAIGRAGPWIRAAIALSAVAVAASTLACAALFTTGLSLAPG